MVFVVSCDCSTGKWVLVPVSRHSSSAGLRVTAGRDLRFGRLPNPLWQCWVPLRRRGLETGTHNFIFYLHDLWPVRLSWLTGSLWKEVPVKMTREGSVCCISQTMRSAEGVQSYCSHKAQWSLLSTGQPVSGKCCCSGGGWFCNVSTPIHLDRREQEALSTSP